MIPLITRIPPSCLIVFILSFLSLLPLPSLSARDTLKFFFSYLNSRNQQKRKFKVGYGGWGAANVVCFRGHPSESYKWFFFDTLPQNVPTMTSRRQSSKCFQRGQYPLNRVHLYFLVSSTVRHEHHHHYHHRYHHHYCQRYYYFAATVIVDSTG